MLSFDIPVPVSVTETLSSSVGSPVSVHGVQQRKCFSLGPFIRGWQRLPQRSRERTTHLGCVGQRAHFVRDEMAFRLQRLFSQSRDEHFCGMLVHERQRAGRLGRVAGGVRLYRLWEGSAIVPLAGVCSRMALTVNARVRCVHACVSVFGETAPRRHTPPLGSWLCHV